MRKDDEWSLFRKPSGQRSYHRKCLHCKRHCKQSFRVALVFCPHFEKR